MSFFNNIFFLTFSSFPFWALCYLPLGSRPVQDDWFGDNVAIQHEANTEQRVPWCVNANAERSGVGGIYKGKGVFRSAATPQGGSIVVVCTTQLLSRERCFKTQTLAWTPIQSRGVLVCRHYHVLLGIQSNIGAQRRFRLLLIVGLKHFPVA